MTVFITLDHVRAALSLGQFDHVAAQEGMAPNPRRVLPENEGKPPREAGVLILLYPEDAQLHIVLTRRTEQLGSHSGQISFPGGRRDASDENLTVTALRETCEELGICDDLVIMGLLSPFYIPPSHFIVTPTVAISEEKPVFSPNPFEVAEVIALPLNDLINPAKKGVDVTEFRGVTVHVPFYQVGAHKVWGATAVMLGELEARLRLALQT